MVRRGNRTPTVFTNEVILEGTNNTTSARILFENDRIIFQNTRTGENLLNINSDNSGISFNSAISLPDGTLLNTVDDLNTRDFEFRSSSPVVIYDNETTPKEPGTFLVLQAILTRLDDVSARFEFDPPDIEYVFDVEDTNKNTILIPVGSFENVDRLTVTAYGDEFSETLIITKLLEGSEGISVVVTNPSDVIAADSNGGAYQSDLENTRGQFILYKGAVNLTEAQKVLYRVENESPYFDMEIGDTTGVYEVTTFGGGLETLRGGATLIASYNNVEYPFIYKVVKAVAGQKGESGGTGEAGTSPYLGIINDENVFIDTENNDNVANIAENAVGPIRTVEINGSSKNLFPLKDTIGTFIVYRGNEQLDSVALTSLKFYVLGDDGEQELSVHVKNGLYFQIDENTGEYSALIENRAVQNINGWIEDSQFESFTLISELDGVEIARKNIKIQKTKLGKDGKTGPSLDLVLDPPFFQFNSEGEPLYPERPLVVRITPNFVAEYYEDFNVKLTSNPPITKLLVDQHRNTTNGNLNNDPIEIPLDVQDFKDPDTGEYYTSVRLVSQIEADVIDLTTLETTREVVLEDPNTILRTQSGANAKSIVLSADNFFFAFQNINENSQAVQSLTEFVSINIKTQNLKNQIDTTKITITDSSGSPIAFPSGYSLTQIGDSGENWEFKLYINSNDNSKLSFNAKTRNQIDSVFPIKIEVEAEGSFDILTIGKLETSDGLSGQLTNEVDEIPAFLDGNTDIGDYISLFGNFQVFQGIKQIGQAEGVTFSVVPETDPDMDVEIDDTGFYYVVSDSIKQGVDTARRFIRATYNGTSIDKIFTVVKNFQNRTKLGVILTNETHLIRASTTAGSFLLQNTYETDLNAAGGNVRVFSGNDEKTLLSTYEVLVDGEDSDPAPNGTVTKNGLTFTIEETGAYSLSTTGYSAWTTELETFYIRITYGLDSVIKKYKISKSKGDINSFLVSLSATSQTFKFNNDNQLIPSGQRIVFTADTRPTNDPPVISNWSATSNGVDYTNLLKETIPPDPFKKQIAAADFRENNLTELAVTAFIQGDTLSDTLSIIKTIDNSPSAKTLKITTTSNVVSYPEKGTLTPVPNAITVFVDGTNLVTDLSEDLILIEDRDGNIFPTPSLTTDQIDSYDKYFTINIGEETGKIAKSQFPITISATVDGVRDIVTINALEGGSNGVNVLLTNESHVIPAEASGDVALQDLTEAGGILELYEGISKQQNSLGLTDVVKFGIKSEQQSLVSTLTKDSGLIMTVDESTGIYVLSETSGENGGWKGSNVETFELAAEYAGNIYNKKYTITKSKEGPTGLPGRDGKTVILESTKYFIPYKEDNTTSVFSITLTATGYNIDDSKTVTFEFLKESDVVTGHSPLSSTSAQLIISSDLPTPGETDTYFVNVYETDSGETLDKVRDQVAQDSVSIVATKEGSDAITVSIPNDNHTFTANPDGTVQDNSNSGTKIQVLVGNTVLNAVDSTTADAQLQSGQFKVEATPSSGVTAGGLSKTDPEGTVYKSITMDDNVTINADTNNGTITFTITLVKPNSSTPTTITRIASYSKSVEGAPGADARNLFLQADAQGFFVDKNSNIINSQINFSVIRENIPDSINVTYSTDRYAPLTGTGDNKTLTFSNFGPNQDSLKVTATTDEYEGKTYTSSITIGKIESGRDGNPGSDGQDAKAVKLESNDYQIAYDSAGNNPNGNPGGFVTLTATPNTELITGGPIGYSPFYKFLKDGITVQGPSMSDRYFFYYDNTRAGFGNPKTFTVQVYYGTSNSSVGSSVIASDSISIVATKEGDSAFTIVTPNDNHTFSATEDGTVTSYDDGGTDIEVYYGNTKLTPSNATNISNNQFKVTVDSRSGIDSDNPTVNTTDNKFVLSNLRSMTADDASIVLKIEIKINSVTQTFYRTLSYTKSKKGTDGLDGINGVDGVDGVDGIAAEDIYNFSSIDSNGKAYGWKVSPITFSSTTSFPPENYSYPGDFPISNGDAPTEADADAEYGPRVLKANFASYFKKKGYVYSNKIVLQKKVQNILEFRYKRDNYSPTYESDNASAVGAALYLIFLDENEETLKYTPPLSSDSYPVYHKFNIIPQGFQIQSNEWRYNRVIYNWRGTANSITSQTEGQPGWSQADAVNARGSFPPGAYYVIPVIEYGWTKNTSKAASINLYMDVFGFEKKDYFADNGRLGIDLLGDIDQNVSLHLGGQIKIGNLPTFNTANYIVHSGNILGLSASDERLKENVKQISGSLEKIKNLRGVTFNWKETSEKSYGFIAQEIEKVIPELAGTNPDGYKHVKYPEFTSLLLEAIKELSSQIEELKKEIEELKNK